MFHHHQAVSLQSVEVPSIVKETEILIEVRAASLDPVDLKVMIHSMANNAETDVCTLCQQYCVSQCDCKGNGWRDYFTVRFTSLLFQCKKENNIIMFDSACRKLP